jgi:sensor histidine kinase YesM
MKCKNSTKEIQVKKTFFCFIIFLLIFFGVIKAHDNSKSSPFNIINSINKSIFLTHWRVNKDSLPEKIFSINSKGISVEKIWGNEKYYKGNWYLSTTILIKDSLSSDKVYGLFPASFLSAYEIYWDNYKVGQNGVIGQNINTEKAGKFNFNSTIPSHLLTKGKHSITFRISNYRDDSGWKWYNGWCTFGQYDFQLKKIYESRYKAFFIAGILSIPFLFNIFLFITRKRKPEHLLFSLICALVIMDFLTNQVPVFFNVNTTYAHLEIYIYSFLLIANSVLFPSFFIYLFSFPKKILITPIIIINISIYYFLTDIWNMFNIMGVTVLLQSTLFTLWAIDKKKEGSFVILIGIIAAWVGYFYNLGFVSLAAIMVICTSFSIARQFARKEKGEREAQLRSTRLENELLKKNINSHFLMNSLTSIIVWLRREPDTAIKLVEALADEFKMVTQISGLKQIPVKQEIELCRTHLAIMNYRKGAEFKLVTVDINEEEMVPPMIFHTLIENGLTHGYENKNNGNFIFSQKTLPRGIQYIVTNDGEFTNCEKKNSNGLGLQYIKTRLEESFPGKWNLESCRNNNSWEVIIEIKK